jgi:hypothetical protein
MNVPEDVVSLVRRAAAAVPANTWYLEEVRRRGNRRRWVTPMVYLGRRRQRASLLVAAGVALLAAGATTVFGTGDGQPYEPAVVVWAGAADADHLYAIGADCPGERCAIRFLGSDDGGRTWTERNDRIVVKPMFLPGGQLFAVITRRDAAPRLEADKADVGRPQVPAISADGGRTWQDLSVSLSPRPAATAAELPVWACDRDQDNCGVFVVDPVRLELRPLARQPSLDMTTRMSDQPVIRSADGLSVWATGHVAQGTLTVAVSRDGGNVWANTSIPCPDCIGIDVWPATTELAYVTGNTGRPDGRMLAFRTTDGGRTWQRLAVDFQRPHGVVEASGGGPAYTGHGGTVVTTDGQLIIAEVTTDLTLLRVVRTWISSPDSADMTPVALTAFPTRLSSLTGGPSTGYLGTSGDTTTIAHSVDGRMWSPLTVR